MDQGAKSPAGFDAKSNLSLASDHGDVDLFTTDTTRNLAAGAQTRYAVQVKSLPGEYTIPIRFSGANTGTETAQTLLTLTLHVRDSIVLAIACLLAALILSFIVTKILVALQHRAVADQQIRAMAKARAGDANSSPAAVWVSAMLHLSAKLNSRYWRTGADMIDSRVSSTKAMMGLLDQVDELRTNLGAIPSALARRRAVHAIDGILSKLDPSAADATKIDAVKTQVAVLNDWLKPETRPRIFWTTIQPALDQLRRTTSAWNDVPDAAKDAIETLKTSLTTNLTTAPVTLDNVEQASTHACNSSTSIAPTPRYLTHCAPSRT